MSNLTKIICPKCGADIDVNKVLYHQLQASVKEELGSEMQEQRQKFTKAMEEVKAKEASILRKEEQFNTVLQEKLTKERALLTSDIKTKITEEHSERIALMEQELEEKSLQVIELNQTKAQIEKLKREKSELFEKIKLEAQKQLTLRLDSERKKIYKTAQDQNELKFKEKEKQLADLHQKLEEARQKAELGSQQSQGEVQELAIEEWLNIHFPFDVIEEIKKGVRGADCLQIVHTREAQNLGTIYYESKRTKEFQKSWIEKFKEDMREKGADIGVLVTEVLPKELERMGLIDGVWVCTYEEFKALSFILREQIVKLSQAVQFQENKSDKSSLLYGYLTSAEFRMQIETIVESFTQMQADLESEKRALTRIWKQREKQISKVLDSTVGMYGAIKGIAGSSLGSIEALELPYNNIID